MEPNTPIGQLNQSMQANVPAPAQVSGGSPNFQPSLQPPVNTPMPEKSPATMMHLHGALKRRGIDPATIPQMMSPQGQPVPNGAQNPPPASQPFQPLPAHPVMNQPPTNLTNPQPVEKPLSESGALVKALEKIAGTFGKRLDKHSEHETAIREHLFPPKEETTEKEE
jgi:hypothetical protein